MLTRAEVLFAEGILGHAMIRANRIHLGVTLALLALCTRTPSLPAGDAPAKEPGYYENLIQIVGQEDSGEWSLRLPDTAYRARAKFHFSALWKYHPASKKWEIVDRPDVTYTIVSPKDKAGDSPDDSQILADLPEIKARSRGLYYAKWEVDGTPGATFCRLGSASVTSHSDEEGKAAPKGMIGTVVPVDADHSVFAIIPDPKVACVEEPATQPADKQH